jgi:two-component system NtrC family sensor kinase
MFRFNLFIKLFFLLFFVSVLPVIISGILTFFSFREFIAGAFVTLEDIQLQVLITVLVTAIFSVFFSVLIAKNIYSRILLLLKGAKKIGRGELDYLIPEEGDDELTELTSAFNQATKNLAASRLQLEKHSLELEQKVDERTRQLREVHDKLVKSEKLASITQLIVSLNHEINNPLTIVLGNIQILLSRLEAGKDEFLIRLLTDAQEQTRRIKQILFDLRRISEPVVEEYIPGIKMIDIKKSIGKGNY